MDRRHILKLAGGGFVVSAAALAGFSLTRDPKQAILPWVKAGAYEDIRLNALSYAILAPNPHNRQPWLVELVNDDTIRLYRDLDKNLPHTDPFDRQLTIGMGCFLACLDLALGQQGFAAQTSLFPSGSDDYVAEIKVVKGTQSARDGELFKAVLERRSCKEPFLDQPISAQHITGMQAYGAVITQAADVETLRNISLDAFLVEYQTPHTMKESVDLMRIGKSEINAQPDGIDLGGASLELLNLAGVMTRETLLDPNSSAYQQGQTMYEEMLTSTPAYILLKTQGNKRSHQIEAGRRWLRLNLAATALGLSVQPVSQALQEYAEMKPHYQKIHKVFAQPSQTIQMFGRLGYGPKVSPSPRWDLEKKIISSDI